MSLQGGGGKKLPLKCVSLHCKQNMKYKLHLSVKLKKKKRENLAILTAVVIRFVELMLHKQLQHTVSDDKSGASCLENLEGTKDTQSTNAINTVSPNTSRTCRYSDSP